MKPSQIALFTILCVAGASAQVHDGYNYEESGVKPYTMLDPLTFTDGHRVHNLKDWPLRRAQILQLFEENVYGRTPASSHVRLSATLDESDASALNGIAIRRQVALQLPSPSPATAAQYRNLPRVLHLLIYLPAKATHPVPLVLGLNFAGNPSVNSDPGILLTPIWTRHPSATSDAPDTAPSYTHDPAPASSRGTQSSEWQVDEILARGYGFATIYYGDIEPDNPAGIASSIRPLFFAPGQTAPLPDEWGAFGAWAWGLSRALDYFQTVPQVDGSRIAVTGHSRLGKTADWAAAQDTRFAMILSTESGKAGQSLLRRSLGEDIRHLEDSFPYWFCANFKQWIGREKELPVDGNLLLSLLAPRPLYVASAEGDRWSDPRGEFLSAADVGRVYALFGKRGLETTQMPQVDHPIQHDVAYHIRTGKHDVTAFDWNAYLDFMDAQWKRQQP